MNNPKSLLPATTDREARACAAVDKYVSATRKISKKTQNSKTSISAYNLNMSKMRKNAKKEFSHDVTRQRFPSRSGPTSIFGRVFYFHSGHFDSFLIRDRVIRNVIVV